MNEEKNKTLTNCLFILVSSYNTALDRLDILTDRQEKLFEILERLITQNEKAFALAQEDFYRKLIEAEVNKEIEKNKTKTDFRKRQQPNGADRKTSKKIAFNITSGC